MKFFTVSAFSSSSALKYHGHHRHQVVIHSIPCQHTAKRYVGLSTQSITTALATTSSPTDAIVVNTHLPVSRISVCTGELCQCQGEQYEYTGGAADAVVDELQRIGLPFPIDEVGCLVSGERCSCDAHFFLHWF